MTKEDDFRDSDIVSFFKVKRKVNTSPSCTPSQGKSGISTGVFSQKKGEAFPDLAENLGVTSYNYRSRGVCSDVVFENS